MAAGKKKSKPSTIVSVLQVLGRWAKTLCEERAFDGAYVFGTLVTAKQQFNPARSDADLVVLLNPRLDDDPVGRVDAAFQLREHVHQLEVELCDLLARKQDECVVSTVLITDFELRYGVHKSGNWNFYNASEFQDLLDLSSEPARLRSPGRLPASREICQAAIECLQHAHEYRNKFLRQTAQGALAVSDWQPPRATAESIDAEAEPIPKNIARAAAHLVSFLEDRLVNDQPVEGTEVFDVNRGCDYLTFRLEELYDDGPRYAELRNWYSLRRGRGSVDALTPGQILLLWEILAHDATSGLRQRAACVAGPARYLTLSDPVHQSIGLERRITPLLRESLVQRLDGIRQLPYCGAFSSSATHTRLSHSLGVAHLASQAVRTILAKGWLYSADGRRPIRVRPGRRKYATWQLRDDEIDRLALTATVTGLVHDVGHAPFAHALDRVLAMRADLFPAVSLPAKVDKELGARYIETELADAIRESGVDPAVVAKIIGGRSHELSPWEALVAQVVDSEADVDRTDYLLRDALFTAMPIGAMVNSDALADAMRPYLYADSGAIKLTFDERSRAHLEQLILARGLMYLHCYEHRFKLAAERLLQRIAERLLSGGVDVSELARLDDSGLVSVARGERSDPQVGGSLAMLENLEYSRYEEIARFPIGGRNEQGGAAQSAFRQALEVAWHDQRIAGFADDAEESMCRAAGLEPSRAEVLAVIPSPPSRHGKKPLNIEILARDGEGFKAVQLVSDSSRTDLLSGTGPLLNPRLVPPKRDERVSTWIRRYHKTTNATGESVLSIIGRARSNIIVLVHRSLGAPQQERVREWAQQNLGE